MVTLKKSLYNWLESKETDDVKIGKESYRAWDWLDKRFYYGYKDIYVLKLHNFYDYSVKWNDDLECWEVSIYGQA